MKRFIFSFFFSITLISLFLIISANKMHAAGFPDGARCITAPTAIFDSQCASGFCKSFTQAFPGLPGRCEPRPKATNCKCDPDQKPRPGKNGFTCDYNGQQKHAWCKNETNICTLQAGATYLEYSTDHEDDELPDGVGAVGIACITPANYKPPAPPVPPCAPKHIDSRGRCTGIVSSLGIINTEPGEFIVKLFGIMLGVSGSIALIIMLRSGYNIMSARGNAEGIQKGREQIVSAIIGLIFLIFSFVLLQVITVDLLNIPGITK